MISGGANVGGSILNAASQAAQNRKSRKWSEKMYAIQRADALADWNRETSYNSPAEQMKRLRDANLNPALLYGNGAVAEAPRVRSSDAPSWDPKAPDWGSGVQNLGDAFAMMYDIKLKEAQTNNVMAATDVSAEEKLLKRAQTFATLSSTGKTDLEAQELMIKLSNAQSLSDISVDTARANLNRTYAETEISLQANERAAIAQSSTLKEAAMRILHMQYQNAKSVDERREISARIDQIQKSTEIMEEDLKLKRQGIQPHDKLFQRKVVEAINNIPKWNGKLLPAGMEKVIKYKPKRYIPH